ncbi:MAG: NMD3-related protein [Candidatus Woesearchaeota archaeon]
MRERKKLTQTQEPLIIGHKPIVITQCVKSNRIKKNKRWVQVDLKQELIREISKKILINPHAQNEKVTIKIDDEFATVTISATMHKEKLTQEYQIPYTIHKDIAPTYAKQDGESFDCIVHLIHANEQLLDAFFTQLEAQEEKGVLLTKKEQKNDSYTFHLTKKNAVRSMMTKLQSQFGGQLKADMRVAGYDHVTSKLRSRSTLTLICFPFQKNDFLFDAQQQLYRVMSVQTTAKLQAIDGDKQTITTDQIQDFTLAKPQKTQLTQIRPPHALHPDTFEELPVRVLPHQTFTAKKEIPVIFYNNQLIYVPI